MDAPVADAALAALAEVSFAHTRDLESIWSDRVVHVPAIQQPLFHRVLDDFRRGTSADAAEKPMGWAVVGPAGTGKTHLLGALRQAVWDHGGWFILFDLLDVNDFWSTIALGMIDSLARPMPAKFQGRTQAMELMHRLGARFGLPPNWFDNLETPGDGAWNDVSRTLSAALRREDGRQAATHRDVVLGFLGILSENPDRQDAAQAWLRGTMLDEEPRGSLGLMRGALAPRKAVEGLSWLMSLGGPAMCAMDQIDAIVSVAHHRSKADDADSAGAQDRARALIDEIAGGLMDLRDATQRTMTLVGALETSWEVLSGRAVASFRDRFHIGGLQMRLDPEAARDLVAKRLAPGFERAGFQAPWPTWPFRPEAFDGVTSFGPRRLLQACRAHIETCLQTGRVEELQAFPGSEGSSGPVPAAAPSVERPQPPEQTPSRLAPSGSKLDSRYAELCALPPPPDLLNGGVEDSRVARLLRAALHVLARQTQGPDTQDIMVETDTPGLTARLRYIDVESGRERHYCFRAIPQTNAIAVQNRLQAAMTASGIDRELPFRHLIVLRRGGWPGGPRTAALVREFEVRRGRVVTPDEADFARFAALETMLKEADPALDAWLRQRRPLDDSAFFRVLDLVAGSAQPQTPPPVGPRAATAPIVPAAQPAHDPGGPVEPRGGPAEIPVGVRPGDRAVVGVPLTLLPRHVAVVAGAGAGKTVLLRRLIEEAVLLGVPAIVLDSNNDLVRLGDAWPQRPAQHSDADAAKAVAYLGKTDLVIWTPGRQRGNPLALAPLPDFAAVRDDPDELEQAVQMAAATLETLVPTGGQKGGLRAGVVNDALRHFARAGTGRLPEFVNLLRELPEDASRIGNAAKLAGEAADALLAAMARNPLLDGAGTPLDPARLLAGPPDKVRVSVVSLAGLPGEEARQDFVGRLLMALFAHIRRHPATPDRAVCGLLVMDEAQNFAPSERTSPSRVAAVALARQARKYGLGMLFATQAPKAVDHNIIANCTTQLFGRTSSPASLDAVREMLRSRGGGGDDLGRLTAGEFYLTTEGTQRAVKLHTPYCLSWHPSSPPPEDEVIDRAARTRPIA